MPETPQNTIVPQMKFIQSTLLDLANSVQGDCRRASNLRDFWQQVAQDSQTPLILICWGGEKPWSSNPNIAAVTYRVTRKWLIGIKQGRGYDAVRGDSQDNFLPFVEQVRDKIRSMVGVSEDIGMDYEGIEPWSMGTQVIDAYVISVTSKNDLPQILQTPDD